MNRVYSILLLGILAVSAGGSRMAFQGFQYTRRMALSSLQERVEPIRNPEKLILKVPVLLPYAHDGSGYEPVHGVLTYRGDSYLAEKRIIRNDTLCTVYIRHSSSDLLRSPLAALAGLFCTFPPSGPTCMPCPENLSTEYLPGSFLQSLAAYFSAGRHTGYTRIYGLLEGSTAVPDRPPSGYPCVYPF